MRESPQSDQSGVWMREQRRPQSTADPMAAPPTDPERAAILRVLRDLQVETKGLLLSRTAVTAHQVTLRLRTTAIEMFLASGPRDNESLLAWRFAEQVQEHLIEKSGQARPPCPLHGHPLSPDIDGTGAFWVCPQGPAHVKVLIGQLDTPTNDHPMQ